MDSHKVSFRARKIVTALLCCLLSALMAITLSGCLTAALISAATTEGFLGSGNDEPVYEEVDFGVDDQRTSMTIMLYMIGSNLESESGLATTDLQEMIDADLGDRVTIAVEAGGAKRWRNNLFESGKVQRCILEDDGIAVEENLGRVNMGTPNELASFITWAKKACPADRYALILWDHGGGAIAGFGQDEVYNDSGMSVAEIRKALHAGDTHFEFVGFDACLMANLETALAVAPYADYLIASEETEPGSGWYYTQWLTALGQNPSADIPSLGKKIISDYTAGNMFWEEFTLSVVDLDKVDEVYDALCAYLGDIDSQLNYRNYRDIANARSSCKAFGEGKYEQIDIVSYIDVMQSGGRDVIDAMAEAVVNYGGNARGAYGLAMYFPSSYPQYYSQVRNELKGVGITDKRYLGFFDDYISIASGGQLFGLFRSTSPVEDLTGADEATEEEIAAVAEELEEVTEESWFTDPEELGFTEQEYSTLGEEDLVLAEKNDFYVLQLTDNQWDEITMVETSVILEMDGGYVDLGIDNRYEFDKDGDLLVDYDYYWLALDGHIVPFYNTEDTYDVDDNWYSYGYVPAVLNGEQDILIKVYWDDDHPDGVVTGYRLVVDEDEAQATGVYQRAENQFDIGDEITINFDFYNEEGELDSNYSFYDPIVVGEKGLQVSYEEVAEYPSNVCMMLTDIYGVIHYTQTVNFWFE